ncbi:MAG TPA: OmpA family protein [bacterium]|nr:OmpA family protein [bacterium]
MKKGYALAGALVIGLCLLFSMPHTSSAGVVTMPAEFNWLFSDADYGKIVGTIGVAEEIYDRGIELLYHGSFSEAAECFWRVIDIYSGFSTLDRHTRVASSYYYLGKTYLLAGKPDLAKGLFHLAALTNPVGEGIEVQVDLSYSFNDILRQRLRNFALERELALERSGARTAAGPAEWQETIPMDSLFETNEYTLRPDAMARLGRLARRMKVSHGLTFVIESHGDDVGTQEYNLRLGNKRAEAVRDALLGWGVQIYSVKCFAHGQRFPVASNDTEQGRYKNRRLVVKAVKQ